MLISPTPPARISPGKKKSLKGDEASRSIERFKKLPSGMIIIMIPELVAKRLIRAVKIKSSVRMENFKLTNCSNSNKNKLIIIKCPGDVHQWL